MCASMSVATAVTKRSKLKCTMANGSTSARANRAKTVKPPDINQPKINCSGRLRIAPRRRFLVQTLSVDFEAKYLIYTAFELGQLLLSANHIRFSGTPEREQLFLATDIRLGGIEFGLFTSNRGRVRSFDRQSQGCFSFGQICFHDFAGGELLLFP